MPQNLPSLCKHHFLKYNEDIYCQQNDKVLYGRTSTLPVHDRWNDPLETICNDKVSGAAHYELKEEDHRYSGDNKCNMINIESTSQCQNFNEEHYALCHDKNDFTFQSVQWLNSPEKDLLLNTALVAQVSRRQTLHRNNLCFQWLNTADNELFLNTAFVAKTSRRRHTK